MATPDKTPTPNLVALKSELDPETTTLAERFVKLSGIVVTAQNYAPVAQYLAEVKGIWKRLDEREKMITKPMRYALEQVYALFKPAKQKCRDIEDLLKNKIGEYEVRAGERVADAENRAAELAAAGDANGAAAVLMEISGPDEVTKVEGLSVREDWDFELVNLEIVPRGFLLLNTPAVRGEMRRQLKVAPGAVPEMAGIRFFKKTTVASKSA